MRTAASRRILMYLSRLRRALCLSSIVGRAKGSIQGRIKPDKEVAARYRLVLRGTALEKATRVVICRGQGHGRCRGEN